MDGCNAKFNIYPIKTILLSLYIFNYVTNPKDIFNMEIWIYGQDKYAVGDCPCDPKGIEKSHIAVARIVAQEGVEISAGIDIVSLKCLV